jgi:hypothetical protein
MKNANMVVIWVHHALKGLVLHMFMQWMLMVQEVTRVESSITNHSLMGEHLEEHSRSSAVKWVAI